MFFTGVDKQISLCNPSRFLRFWAQKYNKCNLITFHSSRYQTRFVLFQQTENNLFSKENSPFDWKSTVKTCFGCTDTPKFLHQCFQNTFKMLTALLCFTWPFFRRVLYSVIKTPQSILTYHYTKLILITLRSSCEPLLMVPKISNTFQDLARVSWSMISANQH